MELQSYTFRMVNVSVKAVPISRKMIKSQRILRTSCHRSRFGLNIFSENRLFVNILFGARFRYVFIQGEPSMRVRH